MKTIGGNSRGWQPVRSTEQQTRWRYFVLATSLLALGVLALSMDLPLAHAARQDVLPGDLQALISLSEVFAHGMGVAVILILIWTIAVEHRRKLARVAACAVVPGIFATLIKLMIHRDRPSSLAELPTRVSDSFHGYLPAFFNGETEQMFDRNFQSFPSGHSATAVGFAIGLSWLFPRGKWCFGILAGLAMLQRVDSGAHFPSDTLFAGALAAMIAGRYIAGTQESRVFDEWESRTVCAGENSEAEEASDSNSINPRQSRQVA